MSRILALRALGLGDLLTGLPALRALRRHEPSARLTLAAPPALGRWFTSLGVVDDFVSAWGPRDFDLPGPLPQLVVNLHGKGPQSHRALQHLGAPDLLAFACTEAGHHDGPAWSAGEHEVDRWARLVQWSGMPCGPDDLRLSPVGPREGHVVVHPGAASGSRRWPAERWAAVARRLVATGRRVVVTGGKAERDLCAQVAAHSGAVDRAGRDDLASLATLVATADLMLCGDTGPAHVATAYRTPSVVLFGPVDPARWGPRVDVPIHRVLWRTQPGDPPGDPHADALDPRLERVTVGEVLAAAHDLLAAAAPQPTAR